MVGANDRRNVLPGFVSVDREDLLIIVSAVVTAVAAVAAVRIDRNLATVATAMGAVVTGIISYWKARRADANARAVARIGADATLDSNARSVLVQTVTSERAVWRREMRAACAELVTILREADATPARSWTRVDRLGTELRLRLNPAGRSPTAAEGAHPLDRAVHDALDAIGELDRTSDCGFADQADTLERAIAGLLKHEWDKSKLEAVTGRLGAADAASAAG